MTDSPGTHGVNAWPASGADLNFYMREGTRWRRQWILTSPGRCETSPSGLRTSHIPLRPSLTRPNRSRVYSVRLSPSEEERVLQLAMDKHLPPSTLVRSWILDRLEQESA